MKAECIAQYKQLEGILDKGDIVEIEPIKTEKDVVVMKLTDMGRTTSKGIIILDSVPDYIVPAGEYIDYRFKSKNGEYYTGKIIDGLIGMKPMEDIFKKL